MIPGISTGGGGLSSADTATSGNRSSDSIRFGDFADNKQSPWLLLGVGFVVVGTIYLMR